MCDKFGWPGGGQAEMKLIRRSVAQLLRDAGKPRGWNEAWRQKDNRVLKEDIEVQLGHRRIKALIDIYAPFEPDYLDSVTQALEGLIDEIIELVPDAFTLSSGKPMRKSK